MKLGNLFLMFTVLLLAIFAGIVLTSCAARSYQMAPEASVDYYVSEGYGYEPGYEMDTAERGLTAYPEEKLLNDGGVGETTLRHVIRNGSINLAVSDTRETVKEIRTMIGSVGGIISNSYIYEIREGQYGAHLTLRVPEKEFDSIMEQLESFGKATNVQTGIDDVTMQYIDLESRLNNQKAQEERLIEILTMAKTVEEVLEVEKELSRVRTEIEAMTTRLTYMQDQIAYATINLSLREETIPTETITAGPFENFGKRIARAFITSINFILRAVSFLVILISALLPVFIILGLVAMLVIFLVRRAGKSKHPAAKSKASAGKKIKQ